MPLYEYVCPECEKRFERLVRSVAAPTDVRCPSCGSVKAERVFSSFATPSSGRADSSSAACGPVG